MTLQAALHQSIPRRKSRPSKYDCGFLFI